MYVASVVSTAGIISTVDGIYRNPSTNDTLSLDDAVKHGLICGEVLDVKRKTEERILDSTNIVAHSVDEADVEKKTHESSLQVLLYGICCVQSLLNYWSIKTKGN